MNTSHYTTAQIRSIISNIIKKRQTLDVIIDSIDDESLIELSKTQECEIRNIDEDKGLLLIEFTQFWGDEIDGWGQ
jgi:hypothetical protein